MIRFSRTQFVNVEERDSETKQMISRSTVHGPFWSLKHLPYRWENFYRYRSPAYRRGWCSTFKRAQAKAKIGEWS